MQEDIAQCPWDHSEVVFRCLVHPLFLLVSCSCREAGYVEDCYLRCQHCRCHRRHCHCHHCHRHRHLDHPGDGGNCEGFDAGDRIFKTISALFHSTRLPRAAPMVLAPSSVGMSSSSLSKSSAIHATYTKAYSGGIGFLWYLASESGGCTSPYATFFFLPVLL